MKQLKAGVVESHSFWREIVAADDRRIAACPPAPQIALLQHGHGGDALLLGQLVGGGQPMSPAADNHDIVFRLERSGRTEHSRFGVLFAPGESEQTVGHA